MRMILMLDLNCLSKLPTSACFATTSFDISHLTRFAYFSPFVPTIASIFHLLKRCFLTLHAPDREYPKLNFALQFSLESVWPSPKPFGVSRRADKFHGKPVPWPGRQSDRSQKCTPKRSPKMHSGKYRKNENDTENFSENFPRKK